MVDDKGRRQEFYDLLEPNQKIAFKVSKTYCRASEDRDDLAQEIVLQLWKAFPAYDRSREFSTWMYRIAWNVAISCLRRQKRLPQVSHDVPLHEVAARESDVVQSDRIEQLYGLIGKLDPLNRALLLLILEEHSHREIADILGISETNVRSPFTSGRNIPVVPAWQKC